MNGRPHDVDLDPGAAPRLRVSCERAGWLAACSGVMSRIRKHVADAGVVGGELRALAMVDEVAARIADMPDITFAAGQG